MKKYEYAIELLEDALKKENIKHGLDVGGIHDISNSRCEENGDMNIDCSAAIALLTKAQGEE